MEFRILTEEDLLQQQELMRYSFNPTEGNYEGINLEELKKYVNPLTYFGLFDGDILASSLIIINYFQKIRGYTFKMGGIAGVATKPEYRRKGLVRKLFNEAFSFCLKEQMPISTLYPFKYSYYEKFDYVWVDNLIFVTGLISDIKKRSIKGYTIEEEKNYLEAITRIKPLYKLFYENIDGLIDRSRSNNVFERRLDNGFFFFSKDEYDNDTGYIVLRFNDKETIEIREFIAPDIETRQNLWNFLFLHKEHRRFFKMPDYFPHEIQTYPYINEPKVEARQLIPNSMLRILNVQDVLTKIKYPYINESIEFSLVDNLCNWNQGFWSLTIFKGLSTLKKIDKKELMMEITIAGLALLLSGFRNTTEIKESGFITGTQEDLKKVDSIFPKGWYIVRDWF